MKSVRKVMDKKKKAGSIDEGYLSIEDMKHKNINMPTFNYKLDIDKIKTLDDVKRVLATLDLRFSKDSTKGIEHLVDEIDLEAFPLGKN